MFHVHASIIRRRPDRVVSVVAASAYRNGKKLYDEVRSIYCDHSHRTDIGAQFILAPDRSPEWVFSPERLWNAVEKRVDSQLCREFDIAFPQVFNVEQAVRVSRKMVQSCFVDAGMVADVALHDIAGKNPHFHVMLAMRRLDENGQFGKKEIAWNDRKIIQECRQAWENICNDELENMGRLELKISCKSYRSRGIEKPRQQHVGAKDMRLWREKEIITPKSAQYVKDQLVQDLLEIQLRIDFIKSAKRRGNQLKLKLMRQACKFNADAIALKRRNDKSEAEMFIAAVRPDEISVDDECVVIASVDVPTNTEAGLKMKLNPDALARIDAEIAISNPQGKQSFSPGLGS